MKIEIGTKVKFLNDTGGGIIKGFTPDEKVLVETEDGFEMPVHPEDLILAEPTLYGFDGEEKTSVPSVQKQQEPKNKPAASLEEKKYAAFKGEVLLALVPENDKLLHVSKFNLYLINDSNYYLNYVVTTGDSGVFTLVNTGNIEPDTKLEIREYNQASIAKIKEIRLQGIYYKPGIMDQVKPVEMIFHLEDISFYKIGFFRENDYFNQKALIHRNEIEFDLKKAIDEIELETLHKVAARKEKKEPEKKTRSPKQTGLEEVDLHIEELVESHAGLSNGEIISIQMARFEVALETALQSKTQRIVFIHGVGNGRLKLELRKKLDRSYTGLKYQDASFKEYGYGATMVYLK